jgi:hypothetical protein
LVRQYFMDGYYPSGAASMVRCAVLWCAVRFFFSFPFFFGLYCRFFCSLLLLFFLHSSSLSSSLPCCLLFSFLSSLFV